MTEIIKTRWQRFAMVAVVLLASITSPLLGFLTFNDGAYAAKKIPDSVMNYYNLYQIIFWNGYEGNRKGGKCPEGSYINGPIAIVGKTAEEKIWNALLSFLTEEQAAGVMGNMETESHFNPAMHEGSFRNSGLDLGSNPGVSYGLGLAQWSFGRRVNLYNYVASMDSSLLDFFNNPSVYSPTVTFSGEQFMAVAGESATDALISLEIQFLKDEVDTSYGGIYNATTVDDASDYWLSKFEIPGHWREQIQTRRNQSHAIYNKYANGGADTDSGDSGSSTVGTVCNTDAGELEEYVRMYAWPEYLKVEGRNYTERMQDYAEAVARRQSEGKYVGGSVDGVAGIDCGGFITTLMQESGYEPGYNGCGSNVPTQEYWLREGDGSSNWEWLNPNGETMDAASLQMGDVAFSGSYTNGCIVGSGHTYMFIGDIEGFSSNVVSASYDGGTGEFIGRAPMAGYEGLSGVRWYRKVR